MEKKVYNEMSHKPTGSYENARDAECSIWIDVLFYNIEIKLEKDNMFKVWQAGCGSNLYLLRQAQGPAIFLKYTVCIFRGIVLFNSRPHLRCTQTRGMEFQHNHWEIWIYCPDKVGCWGLQGLQKMESLFGGFIQFMLGAALKQKAWVVVLGDTKEKKRS